jgi:4'-phosphopantetheinyl transferase
MEIWKLEIGDPWPPPPADLALTGNEVQVWCTSLDRPPDYVSQLAQTLTGDERERASRFKFERHRRRFIVGRGVLRLLLGRYLGLEPGSVRFKYGRQGKPELADSTAPLKFNLSHSEELALYAVTYNQEVGIDLEAIRPLDDLEGIAQRFFSAAENTALATLPPALKQIGFFNCWTRKEAYIKAIGDGLMYPLDQFDVSLLPGEPARLLRIQKDPQALNRWSLHHLAPAPGYVGALAVAGLGWRLACWKWPD